VDGIIVVNKPCGLTSHQVVQAVRRLFPGTRVGHSGTLDPMATGVLPVCLGRATRISEFIIEHPKTYRASVSLGKITDTDDCEGKIIGISTVPRLERNRVEEILTGFQGTIEQLPPRYSAVKYRGKPLYKWARSGQEAPRKIRQAKIYWIKLLEFNPGGEPQLVIDVKCSKGTYIRTLALDIGQALGCGGHLQSLSRLAVGPYNLGDAFTPERIERLCQEKRFEELIRPMDSALSVMPAFYLKQDRVEALKNGQTVKLTDSEIKRQPEYDGLEKRQEEVKMGGKARIYGQDGSFKAIARLEENEPGVRLKTLKYLAP